MKKLVTLGVLVCVAGLPALANDGCDLVSITGTASQNATGASFIGTFNFAVLEPDSNGVLVPTGESHEVECISTLLALHGPANGFTTRDCQGTRPGSRIEFTSFGQFTIVPHPDPTVDGLLDRGRIVQGRGRWDCGEDVEGIDPVTGIPKSTIKQFNLGTGEPGEVVLDGLANLCRCASDD